VNRRSGQIVVVQVLGIFLAVAFFLHSASLSRAMIDRHQSDLSADLTAVSAARVEAENLQMIAAINRAMVLELQSIYVAMIWGVLNPAAAGKVIKHHMQSIDNLNKIEKRFARGNGVLVQWQTQRIARDNGFEVVIIIPLDPTLPLRENPGKMLRDSLTLFTDNPFLKYLPFMDDFKQSVEEVADQVDTAKPGGKGKRKQTFKQKSKNKRQRLKRKPSQRPGLFEGIEISPDDLLSSEGRQKVFGQLLKRLARRIPSPLYLDERYADNLVTVICIDSRGQVRVSSARVRHDELPHDQSVVSHPQNNYINYFVKPTDFNGFQVELVAVPDILEKVPGLSRALEKIMKVIKKSPVEIPLTREHFRGIQH